MYAITGITGKVGGEVARQLLAAGLPVRAVLRDASKAAAWKHSALAEMSDAAALTAAFTGEETALPATGGARKRGALAEGVFVLLPPTFDPSPGFTEAAGQIAAIKSALLAARPGRVVCISTVGAQATQTNLLSQLGMLERALADLPLPVTFLRPGWFMDNCAWDVAKARETGIIPSFLQPLDKPFPMIATADVGLIAAKLLRETWQGHRVVELEAARRVSPNDIAAAFSRLLGKPVRMEAVPRSTWESAFRSGGMKNPEPRMRMLDGFNEGWLDFEAGQPGSTKGTTPLETVLKELLRRHP